MRKLIEWGRRRAGLRDAPRPLVELGGITNTDRERGIEEVAARTGLNRAWIDGVASFYDLIGTDRNRLRCVGTACAFAKPASPETGESTATCLGRCYEAPANSAIAPRAIPYRSLVTEPVVLRHLLAGTPAIHDFDVPDSDTILRTIIDCGLRGRGGAAFATGEKWKVARDTPAPERYVVANGDEGDPGAFVDRLLLEESPHAVLAGMFACARAIGAGRGIVYIRGEYAEAARRVRDAMDEAKAAGNMPGFHVEVVTGAGSYVAGEETALLRSIEGLRAEPSPKPPYPAQRGLFGLPTVIQNVETLSIVPWILRNRRRADTKAICLSGAVATPGVVEIALGTTLRRVIEEGGAGAGTGRCIRMALVGGPMGRVIHEREFDIALDYETLPGLGHGGIVLLDDSVTARELALHLFRFAVAESCGSCAPCRIGTSHLATRTRRDELERLLTTIADGSLCGFGQSLPRPIRDLLRIFGDEVLG